MLAWLHLLLLFCSHRGPHRAVVLGMVICASDLLASVNHWCRRGWTPLDWPAPSNVVKLKTKALCFQKCRSQDFLVSLPAWSTIVLFGGVTCNCLLQNSVNSFVFPLLLLPGPRMGWKLLLRVFIAEQKQEKSQLHSFLGLVYTGTMAGIHPSIDIPFQNKGNFIPEKCPHGGKNRRYPRSWT